MNWDNPVNMQEATSVTPLNKRHGLNLKTGNEWHSLVGYYCNGIRNYEAFYKCYINYCKLMQSPLGQELL